MGARTLRGTSGQVGIVTTVETRVIDTAELLEEAVYFAFPSGCFTYDCVTCGATCCRGHGYVLNTANEVDEHLAREPLLQLFVQRSVDGREASSSLQINNCPPACFFLTNDGLCDLQQKWEYAAKPETCRLFPFNSIRSVGRYLLVAPHHGLCPLQVLPRGRSDPKSRHDVLLREMQTKGVSTAVPICDVALGETAEQAIALERAVLNAASSVDPSVGYLDFVITQLKITSELNNDISTGDEDGQVRQFVNRVAQLLGVEKATRHLADEQLTRTLMALTPLMRSDYVFIPRPISGGRLPEVPLEQVPLVLAGLAIVASSAIEAGMQKVTFQTVLHLSKAFRSLLILLSQLEATLVWKSERPIPIPAGASRDHQIRYLEVGRALLPRAQRRNPRNLWTILEEVCPTQGRDRMDFLSPLSDVLHGSVAAIDHNLGGSVDLRTRLRCAAQRLALVYTDDHLVLQLVNRGRW